ncbi:MAG: polysaccharide deacetylase family protein [Bacteroidales bacterium]
MLKPWVQLRGTHSEGFRVFITFDDGPDARFTPELLKYLEIQGIPASFFLIGKRASDFPLLVEMIRQKGHAIHLHSWDHRKLRKISHKDFRNEVQMCSGFLNSRIFRPPYGVIPLRHLCWLKRSGYKTVLWNVDFADYRDKDHSLQNIMRLIRKIQPGDIILLHNREEFSERTINVLNLLIPALKKKNVTFDRIL